LSCSASSTTVPRLERLSGARVILPTLEDHLLVTLDRRLSLAAVELGVRVKLLI
jgi:hypothetical protein